MRLASFHAADGVRPAVVVGDEIVDVAAGDPALDVPLPELLGRVEDVRRIASSGAHRLPLAGGAWAAPRPSQPRGRRS